MHRIRFHRTALRASVLLRTALVALVLVLRVGPFAGPLPALADDDASVSVSAAASLAASFRAIAAAFEAAHPGARVGLNFAGSATLAHQIREGAPVDVFASADEASMQALVAAGLIAGTPEIFAQNQLQIAVAKGNPHRLAGLADLTRPGLVVVLCGETVPCGRYALEAFRKAGVKPPAGSRELHVNAVLGKVTLGEADAGIVYVTDVRAANDRVEGVGLASAHNVSARYPIAALRDARHAEAARSFIAFVRSAQGTAILEGYGFLKP